jgi:3-hydroxyacyl-CoA dehydrogenase/enoyl-CoA hydratase/3-hydroxybutyryl-CoA epimerase
MPSTPDGSSWRADRRDSGAWTLFFDRPGTSQNSLDAPALVALGRHLDAIEADPTATWLILRSAKPKGFCAGADLRAIAACRTQEEVVAFARLGQAVFERLRVLPIPTIAVIHGVALGGGLELALACHHVMALADPAAPVSLGTPEVRLGLVPGWGAVGALPRRVGLDAGLKLLLGGQPIDADEALRLGLVDRVLGLSDHNDALTAVLALSRPVTPWPPGGWESALDEARRHVSGDVARLRLIEILATDLAGGWADGLTAAAEGLAEMASSPTARAAIAGFLDRRK